MPKLKTPQQCGELAERLIGDYVNECGAYGDIEALPKVLEMLISKAALGIVCVTNHAEPATTILLRTSLTAGAYAEMRKGRTQ